MSVQLTDTHCHLDFNAFDGDRQQALARSWETGLVRIIVPGTDLDSSRAGLALSRENRRISCAVGIHPTSALKWNRQSMEELRRLADDSQVVAVGEIGLDYYWKDTPPEVQHTALEAQLGLAAERSLPVIIHCREAFPDILEIISAWIDGLRERSAALLSAPGVFHAYSGAGADARRLLDLGFCLGVTGVVTFPKATQLQEIVREVPLESLLIETDAPYLAPQAFRGKRNEPAYVLHVAEKIASLRGMPVEDVAEITTRNAARVFHWEEEV